MLTKINEYKEEKEYQVQMVIFIFLIIPLK